MAPASPVPSSVSDSEKKTKKRTSPSKSKKEESEVEDSEPAQSGAEDDDGDEDGDEEVYEIEDILDAKRGHFPKNKLGFLVSWKGYGPEHNSWVAEEDANAPELIAAYWKRNPDKNPNKKKASETPSKRTSTSARKAIADDASDAGGSASVVKKRGRKSVSEKPAAKDDDERPAKKPRKVSEKKTAAARASASEDPMQVDEEEVGNMSEHMQVPTWDQLIKQIDTVERVDDTLYVYFTLQTGERMREDSKICADKFPKMLINFYESNLRWKEADHH
ncbi:hypothetical protein DFH06DRAFT_334494 [Mycena polygramma]|nr:hypothetical protein DFH06DRAFT_334494 [Mycena polygramma]